MSYHSDSVRKMQLLALLTQKGHPFGKFLWGECAFANVCNFILINIIYCSMSVPY